MKLAIKIIKWIALGLLVLVAIVLIGGSIYQAVSQSSDLEKYPAPGKLINIDGSNMHIHCIGSGSPTIILEQGLQSVAAAWGDFHTRIAEFTRVCAYDRAGLGYSEPIENPTSASEVASRLNQLLRAANIDGDLVLIGWSAGGIYIRNYYQQFPDKIRGMMFLDSSHEQQANRIPRGSGNRSDNLLKIAKHLAPFGIVRMTGLISQRIDRGKGTEEYKARLKALYHQSHMLDTVLKESQSFNFDIDSKNPPVSLGDLPLIVISRGDNLPKPESNSPDADLEFLKKKKLAREELQKELAALSSNSKHIIASESGHNIHGDQPELVFNSILELLEMVREQK